VLFTNFQKNQILVSSQFNFKGNPTIYLMGCFIKNKMCYYPIEKIVEIVDEKILKRLKKNNGKLKKFIEKDPQLVYEPVLDDTTGTISKLLKENEQLITDNMNSIGVLKKHINNPLMNEVGL